MDRRRFLNLFLLTGAGAALIVPAPKSGVEEVAVDVKSVRREGDIIYLTLKR